MTATTTENSPAKEPPRIKEWPLIGSLPGMLEDPMKHFLKNYREYGPVYKMSLLGRQYKVICGKEAASFVSSREGRDALTSKDFWNGLHQEYGATDSLPYLDGKAHDDLRQILRHGYSRDPSRAATATWPTLPMMRLPATGGRAHQCPYSSRCST